MCNCDICGKKIKNKKGWLDEFENTLACTKKCHDQWFGQNYIKNHKGHPVKLEYECWTLDRGRGKLKK